MKLIFLYLCIVVKTGSLLLANNFERTACCCLDDVHSSQQRQYVDCREFHKWIIFGDSLNHKYCDLCKESPVISAVVRSSLKNFFKGVSEESFHSALEKTTGGGKNGSCIFSYLNYVLSFEKSRFFDDSRSWHEVFRGDNLNHMIDNLIYRPVLFISDLGNVPSVVKKRRKERELLNPYKKVASILIQANLKPSDVMKHSLISKVASDYNLDITTTQIKIRDLDQKRDLCKTKFLWSWKFIESFMSKL